MKLFLTVTLFLFAEFSSCQSLFPFYSNEKWGFMDTLGKEKIAPQFAQAGMFVDGLAIIVTDEGVGYINESGTIVIEPIYQSGLNFNDGFTSVMLDDDWIVINTEGDMLFEGYFAKPIVFMDKMALIKQEAGLFSKYGFINTYGDTVIYPSFEKASNFSEGLCMASKDGFKYGFIDKTGTWVIEPQYDMGVLTKVNDEYDFSDKDFHDGTAVIVKNSKYGVIDKSNKEIIPCQFDWIGKFSQGLAPARSNFLYGYINKLGEWVIKPTFTLAEPFNNGIALISTGELFDSKWGFIDIHGKKLFEPFIAGNSSFNGDFIFLDGYLPCYIEPGVFGYVGRDGRIIWKF